MHQFQSDTSQFVNYIKGGDIDAQAQLALLNAHKDKLSARVYDLLKVKCYNTFLWNAVVFIRVFGKPDNYPRLARDLNNYVKPFLKKYPLPLSLQPQSLQRLSSRPQSPHLLSRLPFFCSNDVERFLQYQYCIARCMNGDFTSTLPIGDLQGNYWFLKANFTGETREKLITFLMLSKSHSLNMGECYNDAITWIRDPRWTSLLEKYCSQNPGVPAYNFSLLDSNNVVHRLTDYNGKVVIMDFWFNGCENCVFLTPKLKIVRDHFKDNSSVVFLSICSDGLETFKKGVKSGKYTMPGEIDLYSEKGYKNLLYQKINFQGAPTLRLIDKNGAWCENPVDCRLDEGEDLIEKINIALKDQGTCSVVPSESE